MNICSIICIHLILPYFAFGIYEFPSYLDKELSAEDLLIASEVTDADLKSFVKLGIQSVQSRVNLEKHLINSDIAIQKGSLSHAVYLETLPSEEAKIEDKLATKILRSSLYLLNTFCLPRGISGKDCQRIFSKTALPDSILKRKCNLQNETLRVFHSSFRRLMPANYQDGFYKIVGPLSNTKPREISKVMLHNDRNENDNSEQDSSRNLLIVQWAQFIEHDLSKPVVTSMSNGASIECCDTDYTKLSPRYFHPACAPLEGMKTNKYDFEPCLNYVRSALAVNSNCRFGHAEQLNQVVSGLDLSQLYGLPDMEKHIRSYKNGKLKVNMPVSSKLSLLPQAETPTEFCVTNSADCFMAGDSRVNSNPFATMIYTILMRSHNQIAQKLKSKYPKWSDSEIYTEAKNINTLIYRNIVFNDWLPAILGKKLADTIDKEPLKYTSDMNGFGTSNEFAVAAIRFYLSMMPNVLFEHVKPLGHKLEHTNVIAISPEIESPLLFSLKDQFYVSNFTTNPEKINRALQAMLNQNALKMDSLYSDSISKYFLHTELSASKVSGFDSLAWDIQKNRDHGLQPYVKYLEQCENTKISSWSDLSKYIENDVIDKLRSAYKSFKNIDLIVGGISEKSDGESIFGPTFTCILAEQFSNTRQLHYNLQIRNMENLDNLVNNKTLGSSVAAKLLCDTTTLKSVPRNIFMVPSEENPMIQCSNFDEEL